MAARLRRSEAYFRSLVQSGGDAVVILDDDLRITWASPALERVARRRRRRRSSAGRCSTPSTPTTPRRSPPCCRRPGRATPSTVRPDAGLLMLRLPDAAGEWRYLEAGVSDLRGDADVGAVVLHCRDMTERHAREQALQSVAYTDPMTGLPNRAGLPAARCRQAVAERRRAARPRC